MSTNDASLETLTVRPADPSDAPAMARVHVDSWRATYRGLMPDELLDDPSFATRRERFWTAALTGEGSATNRVAVAEHDGEVVGIAMSGPPADADADWDVHLYVLYLLDAHHGSGAGGALLDAVLAPTDRAALWVAGPNPRAQAFYRKRGFVADGTVQVDDGVREVRMLRPSQARLPGVP